MAAPLSSRGCLLTSLPPPWGYRCFEFAPSTLGPENGRPTVLRASSRSPSWSRPPRERVAHWERGPEQRRRGALDERLTQVGGGVTSRHTEHSSARSTGRSGASAGCEADRQSFADRRGQTLLRAARLAVTRERMRAGDVRTGSSTVKLPRRKRMRPLASTVANAAECEWRARIFPGARQVRW